MHERTINRIKLAGGVIAGGASVAAFIWAIHQPKPEGPIVLPPPQRAECPSQPVRADGKCEVSKGEADPSSPTFDRESCGYCGDGVRQIMTTGDRGSSPYIDRETGALVQDVTERPSETPETCPYDFHCGNGRQDRHDSYAAWQESITTRGELTFTIVHVTETGEDCARDFRNQRRTSREVDDPIPDDPLPVFQSGQIWSCPAQVAARDSNDVVASQSGMTQSIFRRIGGIRERSNEIRSALNVRDPDMRVTVTVEILVDPSGHLGIRRVSANCGGTPCGDQQAILNSSQLTLSGLYFPGSPGTPCLWTHNIVLLPGDAASQPSPAPQKPRP